MFTKLSLLIFGLGSLVRGQIVKGLGLLFIQMLYIYYMINSGAYYLSKLPTLGTDQQGWYFDASIGINVRIDGENSLLILLFGIIAVFINVCIIVTAVKSLSAAYKAQTIIAEGNKPPTFRQDIRSLFDNNLHKTLLTLPSLGIIAFTVLPLIFMISMAFTNFDRNHQPPGNLFTWVGFENFTNIFWANPLWARTFVNVLIWTMTWAVAATFSNYILGILLAMYINKKGVRFKKMWRLIFVMTIAVPQFVSLRLMGLLLDDAGTINVILQNIGLISEPIRFLNNGTLAKISIICVNVWVGIPYTMLIASGILMNVPEELYESARMDGASPFTMFRKITMPYMLFVTGPYLITQFVGNINNFNVIFLVNRGNPLNLAYYQAGETDLLVTWLYRLTVDFQDYNLASTIGIIVFVICATISLIFFRKSSAVKQEGEFS